MQALYIFQIATRILTSKLPKLFSIYFLWTNGAIALVWTLSHFQLAKMQKMNVSKHIRNKYRTDVSLNFEFSNRHVYTCH